MRLSSMVEIWICSPIPFNDRGEIVNIHSRLRSCKAVPQRDYNKTDLAVYGQSVNEIMKLYTDAVPDIQEFDRIYLLKPKVQKTVTIDDKEIHDYGTGDYQVESVVPAFIGTRPIKNPTVITARKVLKNHVEITD